MEDIYPAPPGIYKTLWIMGYYISTGAGFHPSTVSLGWQGTYPDWFHLHKKELTTITAGGLNLPTHHPSGENHPPLIRIAINSRKLVTNWNAIIQLIPRLPILPQVANMFFQVANPTYSQQKRTTNRHMLQSNDSTARTNETIRFWFSWTEKNGCRKRIFRIKS